MPSLSWRCIRIKSKTSHLLQLVVVGDIFLFDNTIYRRIKAQYDKKGGRFMRKLASIQKIKRVMPIPDADRLELVQILGWHRNPSKETSAFIYSGGTAFYEGNQ